MSTETSRADAMAGVEEAARTVADAARSADGAGLDLLLDVDLTVTVELGRTRMKIREIMDLANGSVVELGKLASEPVDLLVNDAPFAQGEVVVVEDNFAIRITRLLDRSRSLGGEG